MLHQRGASLRVDRSETPRREILNLAGETIPESMAAVEALTGQKDPNERKKIWLINMSLTSFAIVRGRSQ